MGADGTDRENTEAVLQSSRIGGFASGSSGQGAPESEELPQAVQDTLLDSNTQRMEDGAGGAFHPPVVSDGEVFLSVDDAEVGGRPGSGAPPSNRGSSSSGKRKQTTDSDWPLTTSEWRSAPPRPIIPYGPGSPPLLDSLEVPPLPGDPAVTARCYYLWWSLLDVEETWPFMAAPATGTASAAWDPLTACRCLQQCPYNSIDALAIADACGPLPATYEP